MHSLTGCDLCPYQLPDTVADIQHARRAHLLAHGSAGKRLLAKNTSRQSVVHKANFGRIASSLVAVRVAATKGNTIAHQD